MNRLPGILLCLLVALSGTSALECFLGPELFCSGNDDLCQEFEQGSVQIERLRNPCPAGVDQCSLTSTVVKHDLTGVTVTIRQAGCGSANINATSNKCYGRSEYEKLSPEGKEELKQKEKEQGYKYSDFEFCLCDTDLCNGVSRPAISLTVLTASIVVAMSTVFY